MEVLLVILISLGVATATTYLQPRFMATSFGAQLQTTQFGQILGTMIIVVAGIFLSTLVLGLLTDRDEVIIQNPADLV